MLGSRVPLVVYIGSGSILDGWVWGFRLEMNWMLVGTREDSFLLFLICTCADWGFDLS
jgi:hypothetical protein